MLCVRCIKLAQKRHHHVPSVSKEPISGFEELVRNLGGFGISTLLVHLLLPKPHRSSIGHLLLLRPHRNSKTWPRGRKPLQAIAHGGKVSRLQTYVYSLLVWMCPES